MCVDRTDLQGARRLYCGNAATGTYSFGHGGAVSRFSHHGDFAVSHLPPFEYYAKPENIVYSNPITTQVRYGVLVKSQ